MDKIELAKWAQGVLQLVIDGKKSFEEVVKLLSDTVEKIDRAQTFAKYAESAKQLEAEILEKVAIVSKEFPVVEKAEEVKVEEVKAEEVKVEEVKAEEVVEQ